MAFQTALHADRAELRLIRGVTEPQTRTTRAEAFLAPSNAASTLTELCAAIVVIMRLSSRRAADPELVPGMQALPLLDPSALDLYTAALNAFFRCCVQSYLPIGSKVTLVAAVLPLQVGRFARCIGATTTRTLANAWTFRQLIASLTVLLILPRWREGRFAVAAQVYQN